MRGRPCSDRQCGMLNSALRKIIKSLLCLRYRVRLEGADEVLAKGGESILFLPNHPALIDPVILLAFLHKDFRARALANKERTAIPVVGWLAGRAGTILIPHLAEAGKAGALAVSSGLKELVLGLKRGENVVLYPGGGLSRCSKEAMGHRKAVLRILREAPESRVVLVRVRGLWGSRFSWAHGQRPSVTKAVPLVLRTLLGNLLFFAPRRKVFISLFEPDDFPGQGERDEINSYLEGFFNSVPNPKESVPYHWWQRTLSDSQGA